MSLVQLVMIVKNAGPIIKDVLDSYVKKVDCCTILDTGSTDETIEYIKKSKLKNIKIYHHEFEGFSKSRNRAMELAGNKCKWLFMIDDSYFFTEVSDGAFRKELLKLDTAIMYKPDIVMVSIKSPMGHTYVSKRITRTDKKCRYKGEIHEDIDGDAVYIMKSVLLQDKPPKSQISRTEERLKKDLEILEQDNSVRGTYYKAATNNVLSNIKGMDPEEKQKYRAEAKKWCKKRTELDDDDYEEKFMCFVHLGNYELEVYNSIEAYKYFEKAKDIYPPRAGEAWFYMYVCSYNPEHLKEAYRNRKLGPHRLQIKEEIYTQVIPEEYKHYLNTVVRQSGLSVRE